MSDNGNNTPPEDQKNAKDQQNSSNVENSETQQDVKDQNAASQDGQPSDNREDRPLPLNVKQVKITDQLKTSFINYAMSVIVDRALPDVRDGLKPVHRRSLFAMYNLGIVWGTPTKKSARVVGEVIGKYHPHGDTAVYDTIVRMAQDFSLRYPLIYGQGNFGTLDGDKAAAMRYTEVRMSKLAREVVADLGPKNDFKETVDLVANYDNSEMMPSVMPCRFPNLLVNGTSGIAVGMATNIPTHNMREVINATLATMENPDITVDELLQHIPGPDFPTGGIIYGVSGIREAYETGHGSIVVRARTHIEGKENEKQSIVIDEIPYAVNKKDLVEKINSCIRDKSIEGITEVNDYSGRNHAVRVVIGVRKGEAPEIILNQLFKRTTMQVHFPINMLALNDGHPEVLSLKQIISLFIKFRKEVVTRRSVHELKKNRSIAHNLEGCLVVLNNIDEVIQIIRSSVNRAEAQQRLMDKGWPFGQIDELIERAADGREICRPEDLNSDKYGIHDGLYHLSDLQAAYILDMPLHRLTGLEYNDLKDNYNDLVVKIKYLIEILNNDDKLLGVIRDELVAIRDTYGDDRRSEIQGERPEITKEDLIAAETAVITLSHDGYVKYQPVSEYQVQKRGGRGRRATKMKEEDVIDSMYVVNTHDTILCLTSLGRVFSLKVYELPTSSGNSKGHPIVNLLNLRDGEKVQSIIAVDNLEDDSRYLMLASKYGLVKKTKLSLFRNINKNGIIAISLKEGDSLVSAILTSGKDVIGIFSSDGNACIFNEYYSENDADDGSVEDDSQEDANTDDNQDASENSDESDTNANAKKDISDWWNPNPNSHKGIRPMGRSASGVRAIRLRGDATVVSMILLKQDGGDILVVASNGIGKRSRLNTFRLTARNAKGVIAIKLTEKPDGTMNHVVGVLQVQPQDQLVMISSSGILIRTKVDGISIVGRNSQGVRLINLDEGTELNSIEKLLDEDEENDSNNDINAVESEATSSDAESNTGNTETSVEAKNLEVSNSDEKESEL